MKRNGESSLRALRPASLTYNSIKLAGSKKVSRGGDEVSSPPFYVKIIKYYMEKNLKIKLSKKFSLYGKFSGSFNQPLFIIVHGLLGNMDEEFYYSTTRWFRKHGFSTFRFNLYGYQKDARQLMNCTLKIHGADLDKVVRYFKNEGREKYLLLGIALAD